MITDEEKQKLIAHFRQFKGTYKRSGWIILINGKHFKPDRSPRPGIWSKFKSAHKALINHFAQQTWDFARILVPTPADGSYPYEEITTKQRYLLLNLEAVDLVEMLMNEKIIEIKEVVDYEFSVQL